MKKERKDAWIASSIVMEMLTLHVNVGRRKGSRSEVP